MLLSLMIACAVVAVLLFALGAFDDLREVWAHPEHKDVEDDHPDHAKPRPKPRLG